MLRFLCILLVGLGVSSLALAPAMAVVPAPGDILVADATLAAVVHVDPASGDRAILSSSSVGTGTNFVTPAGIAIEANGQILVSDLALQAIVRVDPGSGDRTVLSSPTVGSGPVFLGPWGLTVGLDGQVYATSLGAVIRVDPATGDRTLATSVDQTYKCLASGDPFACCTGVQAGDGNYPCAPDVGTGPAAYDLRGIAQESESSFLFVESTAPDSSGELYRFSTLTGDRVNVAGVGESPHDLTIESDGKVLVVDPYFYCCIFRIDPDTGNSTQLAGSGPAMSLPMYIALDAAGDALVTDRGEGAVFLVDTATGDRSIVSSSSVGAGPNFAVPLGIAVVGPAQPPVPALPFLGVVTFALLVPAVLLSLRRRGRSATRR